MIRIMVVDNEPSMQRRYQRFLLDKGYRLSSIGSAEEALDKVSEFRPDLVIFDIDQQGGGGLDSLKALRDLDSKLPVIVTASNNSTDNAIGATKLGAFDYVHKPFDASEMLKIVADALESGRLTRSPVALDQNLDATGDALIGRSRPMQEIYKAIGRVAPTDSTVLIRGESGTGKELVARAIFHHSERANRPFVVVNCVAIPESLLESELFGYEKGAFTGASGRRIGKIEQANGGTVFLDEIGDMPAGIQAKILRLLQDRTIERIGGLKPKKVDVRIIAATNRDLESAISQGAFREDLFYRLSVVPLSLPPLRERPGDIIPLAEYFLARHSGSLGVRNPGLTQEALSFLASHPWPGNVRELANAMEQCLIFSRGRPINHQDVANLVLNQTQESVKTPGAPDEALKKWFLAETAHGGDNLMAKMTAHLANVIISEALKITKGNRTKAAQLLGITRPTLLARMERYGLRG